MEFEIKPQRNLSLGLTELWEYRELFYFFTWRDVKVKYKQTVLGFLWAIFQPLIMTLLFTFGFGKMITANGNLGMPYPLFAITGLLLWNVFSSGLSNAGNSMVTNSNIIKKIYFPRLIVPISSILVALFDFFMALIVFVPFVIYYKASIYLHALIYLPASILLTCIASFGLGTLLAALNIKYRDFRYIIPFFIQAMLFATPVIYPIRLTDSSVIQMILRLNPMTGPIELFRASFTRQTVDSSTVIVSGAVSVVLFIYGVFYFRKTEAYFADLA